MLKILTISFAFASLLAAEVLPRDVIAGPVEAQIMRVVDGDTLLVEARPWPQQYVEVYVRIRGIDAPELRSKCQRIRGAGGEARRTLENLTRQSAKIQLTQISGDKYFGRIVADVVLADGRNAAESLRLAGVVREYDGGQKPTQTCGS